MKISKFLDSLDGFFRRYTGIESKHLTPIYTETKDGEVYVFSVMPHKRHLIKEKLSNLNFSDEFTIEDQRRIVRSIGKTLYGDIHFGISDSSSSDFKIREL